MKVLIDTNVLLDVLLEREGKFKSSAVVWELCAKEKVDAYVAAISFNNIHYIVTAQKSREIAYRAVTLVRDIFRTVLLNDRIINQSIDAQWKDFEDAIQYFSAIHADADYIVTRNVSDFPKEGIAIMTPEDFISFTESTLFNHD